LGKSIIHLKNISVKYDNNIVLENINLEIYKKEILTIVGPNGSGKSTLIKTILGFKEPFQGSISIFGENIKKSDRIKKIGYLPQKSSYRDDFPVTIFDVVAMSRYAKKNFFERLNKYDKEIIDKSLNKIKMLPLKDKSFTDLSGGQKQRVLIARALAIEPEILILDEPSTGLDMVAQEDFYQTLVSLKEEGLAILMVSHDIGTVANIVDRVACIKRKLHFHGKPEQCFSDKTMETVFGKNILLVKHDQHCETCQGNK